LSKAWKRFSPNLVLGASEFGAEERVLASIQQSFPGIQWKQLADYMVNRVVVHGARRAREMEEAAEMLRSAGIEPIMAEATARRQDWAAKSNAMIPKIIPGLP